MKDFTEAYEYPIYEIQDIIGRNIGIYYDYKKNKDVFKELTERKTLTGREKFDIFKAVKDTDKYIEKIYIDIRDSSPQYQDERLSLQFSVKKMNYEGIVYYSTMFIDRISFDVDSENDYEWLLKFLNKKISEKNYFKNLDYLFHSILNKKYELLKDTMHKLKVYHNHTQHDLDNYVYKIRNGILKYVSQNKINNKKPEKKAYILKDNNTGLYKIGRSSNPLDREKTLQAEKPTIKLIKIFKDDVERELHNKYKKQRVRGEWFNLNKVQLKYICTHY